MTLTPQRAEILRLRKELRLALLDRANYQKILLDEQDALTLSRAIMLSKYRRTRVELATARQQLLGAQNGCKNLRVKCEAKDVALSEAAGKIKDLSASLAAERAASSAALADVDEDRFSLRAERALLLAENEKLKKLVAELSEEKLKAPAPFSTTVPYFGPPAGCEPTQGQITYVYDAFGHLVEHPAKGAD